MNDSVPLLDPEAPRLIDGTGTAAELNKLADHLVDSGHLTREKADQALRDGHGVEPTRTRAPESTLVEDPNDVEAMFDAVHAPARPDQYALPQLAQPGQELTAEEVAQFDREARTWLSEAGFPREIGSALASEVARVGEHQRDANDQARAAYAAKEQQHLRGMWGAQYAQRLALARDLVRALDARHDGRISEYLEETGAGNSAFRCRDPCRACYRGTLGPLRTVRGRPGAAIRAPALSDRSGGVPSIRGRRCAYALPRSHSSRGGWRRACDAVPASAR